MLQLHPNEKFTDRYTLVERIGYGGFSEVWKVKRDSGFLQAVKIFVNLDMESATMAQEEFERVFNINHQRILKATDYGIYNECPYLAMPYCKNGSALKLVGKLSEQGSAKVIYDIASALEYLHGLENFIIHQDIKPDNFLIDDEGNYMLSDFGISKKLKNRLSIRASSNRMTQVFDSSKNSHIAGYTPPAYRPPETFDADFDSRKPVKASDIWSLGASIYELATGQLPFQEFGGAVQHNVGVKIPNLPKGKFSKEFNEVLQLCLQKDTWDRPTAGQLKTYAENYLKTKKWGVTVVEQDPKVYTIKNQYKPQEAAAAVAVSTPSSKKSNKKKSLVALSMLLVVLLVAVGYFILKPTEPPLPEPLGDTGNTPSSSSGNTEEITQDDNGDPDENPVKDLALDSGNNDEEASAGQDTRPSEVSRRNYNSGPNERTAGKDDVVDNSNNLRTKDLSIPNSGNKKEDNDSGTSGAVGQGTSGLSLPTIKSDTKNDLTVNKDDRKPEYTSSTATKPDDERPEEKPIDPPPPAKTETSKATFSFGKKAANSFLNKKTRLTVSPVQTVSTEKNSKSDNVLFKVVDPIKIDGNTIIAQGTTISGRITDINSPGERKRPARLRVDFSNIQLTDGKTIKFSNLKLTREAKGTKEHVYLSAGGRFDINFTARYEKDLKNYIGWVARK